MLRYLNSFAWCLGLRQPTLPRFSVLQLTPRLRKKALQSAYDQAIKRKMVGVGTAVWVGGWVQAGRLAACLPACSTAVATCAGTGTGQPSSSSPCCLSAVQEEEAATRLGGRGLEEIISEPTRRPEDSGGWVRMAPTTLPPHTPPSPFVSLGYSLPWTHTRCKGQCRRRRPTRNSSLRRPDTWFYARQVSHTGNLFTQTSCPLRPAVYFHPTLNPMGIPPPGKAQK